MIEFLKSTFLFKEIDDADLERLITGIGFTEMHFEKSELVFSEKSENKKIGFVKSGECSVERIHSDGTSTPLNTLKQGASFGIISAFDREEDFPTTVIAKRKSAVVFIEKDKLIDLIKSDTRISFNVSRFLVDRIYFLNNKIKTFSAKTVTEKLACFLIDEYDRRQSLSFPINMKRTSEILSTGRASIYRSLDNLVNEGLIKYESNFIMILDLDGLRRTK